MPVAQGFGTVTKANLKPTQGRVYALHASNANAALRYLQIHDKPTAPIAGDVPVFVWPLAPTSGSNTPSVNPGQLLDQNGIICITGISWAISTTPATFTDAATAAEHVVTVRYG